MDEAMKNTNATQTNLTILEAQPTTVEKSNRTIRSEKSAKLDEREMKPNIATDAEETKTVTTRKRRRHDDDDDDDDIWMNGRAKL
eukprot:CAMPEP_0194066092 /NCGR_PEP_ID=MMETSP0009_2-20130614/85831_1 /TAXON_ID=210454 /ORGANISM="Grammatophora oceanica, Strain CCMP 410" /LENGTH=84 /DNA_ID=CAMNT_0038719007 /DNA_START=1500 /DNA_END=1754 /DNA_ORIENTATION=+